MSSVWSTLIDIQESFEYHFDLTGQEIQEPGLDRFNWYNKVWTSDLYRRAHIDVVDARETKGLWMMHCCVFPHIHNPAPIFGYDVIAGKNKITGCFHDFSPAGDKDHPLINWFSEEVVNLSWRKVRKLPEWAERIFTPSMVSAGNIQLDEELLQIKNMATNNLRYYLENVSETNHTVNNTTSDQNYYCDNQRQNPHTPKVMTSLGLNAEDVRVFIQECLFPKIGDQT
jgi:phycocyanobilin:ferredoxin oxidoreductase